LSELKPSINYGSSTVPPKKRHGSSFQLRLPAALDSGAALLSQYINAGIEDPGSRITQLAEDWKTGSVGLRTPSRKTGDPPTRCPGARINLSHLETPEQLSVAPRSWRLFALWRFGMPS